MGLKKIFILISLLRKAFGRYKMKVLLMAVLGFLGGLLGGIGIGVIVPLFSLIINSQGGSPDIITRTIEKLFSFFHIQYGLASLIALIAGLFIVKTIFLYWANYIIAKITANYERDAREDLFKKTLGASWPFLLEQKVGHLETILINDVNKGSGVLEALSSTILTATSLVAYSIIALNISAVVTLFTLALGVILFFILRPLFYRSRKLSQKWAVSSKTTANQVAESIIGAKAIKSASVENNVLAKVMKFFDELKDARIKLVVYSNLQSSFQEPMSILLVLAIFTFSYTRPDFSFSSFVAVIYLVQKMFAFMQTIQGRLNGINESSPFLKAAIDYRTGANENAEKDITGLSEFSFKKSLEFREVKFAYTGRDEVLSGLNFAVNRGETIGIIGPSGAGKTTIVDLILRHFLPTSGKILLDDRNYLHIGTKEWRSKIGYVSQDIFLLSDTIENNIRFFDQTISGNQIAVAARMANIYDLILGLPGKFSSVAGERGVKLSAGQRQRIVLARALVREPEILILDEATSALDNESEALIQKTLESLKGQMTIIVIAHRLSTVMNCDKLISLENGKIIEQGSPEELLNDVNSYFHKTYSLGVK